tara:strand:- start:626 stop:1171 length:546 start_codon:yes stop_codon:yes gene_type:complete
MSVLLRNSKLEITTPMEQGIHLEVQESGKTFRDNAILKAEAFSSVSGLMSLSDDSGLEVDILNGEPGVMSARYAGPNASDKDRIDYLLEKLRGVPFDRRKARFRCVMAVAAPGGKVEIFEGVCEGIISEEPKGPGGFGYDPIFYIPSLEVSMAQLSMESKNDISHRGIASRKVRDYLASIV